MKTLKFFTHQGKAQGDPVYHLLKNMENVFHEQRLKTKSTYFKAER